VIPMIKRIAWATFLVLFCLAVARPALASPLTFQLPNQILSGAFVSGFLTFDPVGIHFAGPFDIRVTENPTRGIPADDFTNANTFYVIQPNTSFHSLWVFDHELSLPDNNHLFMLVSQDSCLNSPGTPFSCLFEMLVYVGPCSDCVPVASEQSSVRGFVPAPASLGLLLAGLGIVVLVTHMGSSCGSEAEAQGCCRR